jgi:hypothetical protein
MVYPTTKTDGNVEQHLVAAITSLRVSRRAKATTATTTTSATTTTKRQMCMGDVATMRMMMFVSHTRLIELDAFVNKGKEEKENEKDCTIVREKNDADSRQLVVFSTMIYSHGHLFDVITCLSS